MLDKRDIDTTLIDILDDLKYVAVDFRENFSAMKDSLGVAARSIYHSVKFLFDGTTAQAREAFGVNEANLTASIERLEASRNSPSPTKLLLKMVK